MRSAAFYSVGRRKALSGAFREGPREEWSEALSEAKRPIRAVAVVAKLLSLAGPGIAPGLAELAA